MHDAEVAASSQSPVWIVISSESVGQDHDELDAVESVDPLLPAPSGSVAGEVMLGWPDVFSVD